MQKTRYHRGQFIYWLRAMKKTLILSLALVSLAGCNNPQPPARSAAVDPAQLQIAQDLPATQPAQSGAAVQGGAQPPVTLDKPHTDMVSMKTPHITVYKTATCGCCEAWVKHMEQDGFVVAVKNEDNLDAFKDRMGVPGALRSCHTAEVEGLFVEGHVPAADVRSMLARSQKDKQLRGIAVPGMPAGSPGMEMGDVKHPYEVIAVSGDDSAQDVFAKH